MLEVRDLTVAYESSGGRHFAVEGVNLGVEKGELLALLGPSGSGKTTLLHAIAGIVPPLRGEILLRGSVSTHTAIRDRRLAMVLQNLGLYPGRSVRANIEYPMRLAGLRGDERRRRATELMSMLGIEALETRLPRNLSGGERQRVAIARALAREVDLLLLDEPFSDLDAQVRLALRSELRALHLTRGLTTILVTHDQDDAMALGDRIAILLNGRLVVVDTPHRLYREPPTLFIAQFVGRPPMNQFLGRLENGVWVSLEERSALLVALPDGFSAPPGRDLVLGIRPEDLEVVCAGAGWQVVAVECAGREDVVHLVSGPLRALCRGVVTSPLSIGEEVGLRLAGSFHLFDAEDGKRLPL